MANLLCIDISYIASHGYILVQDPQLIFTPLRGITATAFRNLLLRIQLLIMPEDPHRELLPPVASEVLLDALLVLHPIL